MSLIDRVKRKIKDLEQKGRIRFIFSKNPINSINDRVRFIDFSTNDYLGLATNSVNLSLEGNRSRIGTSSSRVLSSNLIYHEKLENELADFTGMESSLLFGSGYLANIGTLSSLINRNDIVLSDKFIHASLIDGINLSKAKNHRFVHNDINHLESLINKLSLSRKKYQEIFIVTESVFSMDGDMAPIAELNFLAKKHGATLIIDEAHAIGVFGDCGGGVLSSLNIENEEIILLGTLSKSLGSYGGFVCASKEIIEFLISTARSFLFSTALPDLLVQTALSSLYLIRENPRWGESLLKKADIFREKLKIHNIITGDSISQIIPINIGEERKTIEVKNLLLSSGINLAAIRPPTVPEGTSRLRCSINLTHSDNDLLYAAAEISKYLN